MRLGLGWVSVALLGLAVSLAAGCNDEDSVKNRTGVDAGSGDGAVSTGGTGGVSFGACVACNPAEAVLSDQGANLFSGGITFSLASQSCAASPTPPPGDELAISFDFNTLEWTGVLSGHSVVFLSAGNSTVDPMGFTQLTNLPTNQAITLVVAQDGTGTGASITFTISDDVSPILTEACVAFEP